MTNSTFIKQIIKGYHQTQVKIFSNLSHGAYIVEINQAVVNKIENKTYNLPGELRGKIKNDLESRLIEGYQDQSGKDQLIIFCKLADKKYLKYINQGRHRVPEITIVDKISSSAGRII